MTSRKSDHWFRLVQVVANVEAELARALQAHHGMGLSEYRALDALARSPDSELRMQELAAHLRLNQSSVSRMAERLERAGFTIRDVCADDKRGVFAVLTKAGRSALDKARPDYEKALGAALRAHGGERLLAGERAAGGR